MKPEVGLYVVGEFTPEDDAHQVYAVHVYSTSITRIQTEPSLIAEDSRAPFHSPFESFTTPGIAVLGGVVV